MYIYPNTERKGEEGVEQKLESGEGVLTVKFDRNTK